GELVADEEALVAGPAGADHPTRRERLADLQFPRHAVHQPRPGAELLADGQEPPRPERGQPLEPAGQLPARHLRPRPGVPGHRLSGVNTSPATPDGETAARNRIAPSARNTCTTPSRVPIASRSPVGDQARASTSADGRTATRSRARPARSAAHTLPARSPTA